MKKLFALGMASVMALSLAACGGSASSAASGAADTSSAATAEATGKKWVVATDTVFKPFEYTDASGNFVGIDVDIMKAVCDKLGRRLEITDTAFDSVVANVERKMADVGVAAMTITDERKKSVDFTEPYMKATQVVIVRK